MRSIWSSGIASSVVAPDDDEPARKPSISTSVCPRFAPRSSAPDTEPGPPFCTISTPGCRCSNSARLCTPLRRISSVPITVTSASTSAIGCDARAAVTTTGSSAAAPGNAPCAVAALAATSRNDDNRTRRRVQGDIGRDKGTSAWRRASPHGHGSMEQRSPIRFPTEVAVGRLQAGLRACRSCPRWPSHPEADSGALRGGPHRLTVAGAAAAFARRVPPFARHRIPVSPAAEDARDGHLLARL